MEFFIIAAAFSICTALVSSVAAFGLGLSGRTGRAAEVCEAVMDISVTLFAVCFAAVLAIGLLR